MTENSVKLLLMADKYVGTKITRWLIKHYRKDIAVVICSSKNEIFESAEGSNLPCTIFESNEKTMKYLQNKKIFPDLGFLVWWPKLVKKPLLDYPKHGFINTHPSLLPFNRGKYPNFWSLVEEVPFGVTLHFVKESVDSGDIVAQSKINYDWEDTGGSVYYKALEETIKLFKKGYPDIRHLNIPHDKQDEEKSTFHLAKELDTASKIELDRQYKGRELLNLLRARTFPGNPACWFEDNDKKYEVRVEIKRKA